MWAWKVLVSWWVLPQVEHVHPPTTIPAYPCHIIRLADLLADEEIAWAHDGYIVAGAEGDYFEFVRDHLQGCLVGRTVLFFPSKVKFLFYPFFFIFLLDNKICMLDFSLHLLKERKGERKRKRFPLLIILVVFLVPSWKSSFSDMTV